MRQTKRTFYRIERAILEKAPVSVVLDMLRYDHAVVEHNPPPGYYLLSCEGSPCVERWRSFLIPLKLGLY